MPSTNTIFSYFTRRAPAPNDPEQQPLLPPNAADPQAAASHTETRAHPTSHLALYRPRSRVDTLLKHHSNRSLILPGGKPNFDLFTRTLVKFSLGTGKIGWEMAAGIAGSALTGVVTQAVLSRITGPNPSVMQQTLIDGVTLILDRKFWPTTPTFTHEESLGIMVLIAAANIEAGQNSSQGTQYALANQLSSRLTKAIDDVLKMIGGLAPTRPEDLHVVFRDLLRSRDQIIRQMPESRRDVVDSLKRAIHDRLAAIKSENYREVTEITGMLKSLDLLLESFENSRHVPKNIWQHDRGGNPEEAKKYDDMAEHLAKQVDEGEEAVETFLASHRMKTASDWKPATKDKGASDMNILVLVGKGGTGKSYISGQIANQFGIQKEVKYVDENGEIHTFARGGVDVTFKRFLTHTSPPETEETKNTGALSDPSPEKKFGSYVEVLRIKPGDIVRMEEADLNGSEGKKKNEPDQDYGNTLKRLFDPNTFGVFTIKGDPEGVEYVVDLRRASVLITTNTLPTDEAVCRRFKIAFCNRVSEPVRRQAARNTVDYFLTAVLDTYYALDAHQKSALKTDMAGLMEFILKEGKKDPGVPNMQIVILDTFHHLAHQYETRKREAVQSAEPVERDPLDSRSDYEHGPKWVDSPDAAIDLTLRTFIRNCFKKHRTFDPVNNLLGKAEKMIAERGDHPLPTTEAYLAMAKEAKLKAKETIRFTEEALLRQWQGALEKRPDDIQNSIRSLAAAALARVTYIFGDKEEEKSGPWFTDAIMYLTLLDAIMRIPTVRKNLSHWEVDGAEEERIHMQEAKGRIKAVVSGEENKKNVEDFVQKAIDDTVPLPGGVPISGRPVLTITGPEGTGKDYTAGYIFDELGLSHLSFTPEEYLKLYEGRTPVKQKGKANITPDTVFGNLAPFLQGEYYGCGISIDGGELSDPRIWERIQQTLRPNAKNPKISFSVVKGVEFEIQLNKMPIVITARKMPTDPAFKSITWNIHLSETTPEIRRSVAEIAFQEQVNLLKSFDFPHSVKKEIVQSAAGMMGYIVEANSKDDPGPAILKQVIPTLFAYLRGKAQDAVLGGEVPEVAEDPEDTFDAIELSWANTAKEDLPRDLLDVVNRTFENYRLVRAAQADGSEQSGPKDARENEGRPAAPSASSDEAMLNQLRRIDLDKLERLANASGIPGQAQSQAEVSTVPPAELDQLLRKLRNINFSRLAEILPEQPALSPSQTRLDNFVSVTTKNVSGHHTLREAARSGNLGEVRTQLGRAIVDPNAFDKATGDTGLHLAAENNHLPVVQAFLNDARVRPITNNRGRNPLHVAAHHGHGSIVQALLNASRKNGTGNGEALFDPNAQDNDGATALSLAVSSGNFDAIKFLIEHKPTDVHKRPVG